MAPTCSALGAWDVRKTPSACARRTTGTKGGIATSEDLGGTGSPKQAMGHPNLGDGKIINDEVYRWDPNFHGFIDGKIIHRGFSWILQFYFFDYPKVTDEQVLV